MDERTPLIRTATAGTEEDFPELDRIESIKFNPAGDSDCPLDWPQAYKWGVVSLLAFMSFTTYVEQATAP
jgi:hypothetical protein